MVQRCTCRLEPYGCVELGLLKLIVLWTGALTTQLENVIANPVCLFKNNGMHFNRLSNNIHMENIIVLCFFFLFLFEVNTVVTGTTGLVGTDDYLAKRHILGMDLKSPLSSFST